MTALAAALTAAGMMPAPLRLRDAALRVLRMPVEEWRAAANENWDNDPALKAKLLSAAMKAIQDNPRSWDGAKDAFYKAVKPDAEMLWELFAPFRQQAVQRQLTEAAAMLRDKDRADVAQKERKVRIRQSDVHAKHLHEGMNAAASVARLSLLDTFRINGKPIGDCTPAVANKWAGLRERDARFVRLLTANLPPDEPIRKYRRPEDVQGFFDAAENADE